MRAKVRLFLKIILLAIVLWLFFPVSVWADPVFEMPPKEVIYTFPTSTPTPTPTIKIEFKPPVYKFFTSPTPTLPAVTGTITPVIVSPTSEVKVSPIEALEEEGPTEVVSPSPTAKPAGGVLGTTIGLKEAAGISVISSLLIIIILQGQWSKIKDWLHKKTE